MVELHRIYDSFVPPTGLCHGIILSFPLHTLNVGSLIYLYYPYPVEHHYRDIYTCFSQNLGEGEYPLDFQGTYNICFLPLQSLDAYLWIRGWKTCSFKGLMVFYNLQDICSLGYILCYFCLNMYHHHHPYFVFDTRFQ